MKRIYVLLVVFLLTGCLNPQWNKVDCPPVVEDTVVPVVGELYEDLDQDLEELDEIEEDLEELLDEPIIEEPVLIDADLPRKEVRAGELVSFPNLQAVDPDGDSIVYTFSEPLDDQGEWQTEEGDEGEYIVTITASDGTSSVDQQVTIIVQPSNFAPTIEIEDTVTVKEGELFALTANITDEDGDEVSVSYEGWQTELPYEVSFDDAGIYSITIIASDGKKEARKDVTVIVENVNQPPTIKSIADATVMEHDTVNMAPQVDDPDGDDVVVSVSLPFTDGKWVTTTGDAGVYEITVEVSDGEYIVQEIFSLTVMEFNDPPQIFADDVTVTEGETVRLDVSAEDPEGEEVTLTISGWMTSYEKATSYDDDGVYEVIITASDGLSESEKTITVTVEDANRSPVFNPGAFS